MFVSDPACQSQSIFVQPPAPPSPRKTNLPNNKSASYYPPNHNSQQPTSLSFGESGSDLEATRGIPLQPSGGLPSGFECVPNTGTAQQQHQLHHHQQQQQRNSRMHRRGSHSQKMLEPTVKVVQGEEQQQQERRLSEPTPMLMNGSFAVRQPQQPLSQPQQFHQRPHHYVQVMQHPVAQRPTVPFGVPQTQQPMQMTGHSFGQPTSMTTAAPQPQRLFVSSMDLMMPSTSFANRLPANTVDSPLFISSSHHTSHIAAAGDLLSMSRCTVDSQIAGANQSDASKKRNSTMTDGGMQQHHQQGNVAQNNMMDQDMSNPPQHYNNNVSAPTGTATSRSSFDSSTTGGNYLRTLGGSNEEPLQHRAIRQCRRSDSFEMMDDGC